MALALGIDIGGTGIKGAVVDTATGDLTTDRVKPGKVHKKLPAQIEAERANDERANAKR